jgi:opacity protein-like surface antigen
VRKALLISISAIALSAFAAAAAEEQSWSKRTPPPVKYAPPPGEQKEHDWSGFHVGVNAGPGFSTSGRESAVPGSLAAPR